MGCETIGPRVIDVRNKSAITRSVPLGDLWSGGCWDRPGVDVVAAGFGWQRGVPGSPGSISGARESKVRTPEDGSDSDTDSATDRKYDDPSADHGKMHDADVAVESANRNMTFDSGIGVDWLKRNNAGSRCEHVTGSRGSVNDPDDVKLQS
ncbi:hypothetical protein LSH36_399g00031 [Paralvinella palmiformis]|uniref:Uncharacterized protein n=1 Tax=Paralvinella palmiformis TaxID=53620 RepID=A0AAD9JDZ2_9ANNE|nr:hypothetical protein LSH36_399g00031 [Paralvinella palmiformis]